MCHSILAAAKMLLLAKPCVSAQAPRLRRSQLQPRRLRRSRLRRGCNFESAPKQVKTTFIHLLPFASSRCTNFHTSAAICLFTLHCSTTQLVALATHSKLLILHFTMHTHTHRADTAHTHSTLSKLAQNLHLTTVPSLLFCFAANHPFSTRPQARPK